ncbi:reductase [Aspergillus sclerotialis]|uniref:Reductase n=1 Tax=Aspergillus sclerotialis TaxID=2070753 RepID=A0A3A3A372_9EURO|nr:reductase [Aspergillus sclerotialis]
MFWDNNQNCPKRAEEIAAKYGAKTKSFQCNATNANAVKIAVDTVVKEFNDRLDVFIASAGIPELNVYG